MKAFLRAILPPIIVSATRRVRRRAQPTWEYVPEGWARKLDARVGWNVASVAEQHRMIWDRWLQAVSGTGPLGVDFWMYLANAGRKGELEPNLALGHNLVMIFGYVLGRTSRGLQKVSVLDWGGGVGQYYPLAKALLPEVEIDYHCKDVPVLAAVGRELLPEVTFHEDDSCLDRRYDLVFAGGSLQYVEDWRGSFRGLARATGRHLLLTRTPTVEQNQSFVVLQRGQKYGFGTDVLEWFLNRDELLACARGPGLGLAREFVMLDNTPAADAPEQARYRGFLFEPVHA